MRYLVVLKHCMLAVCTAIFTYLFLVAVLQSKMMTSLQSIRLGPVRASRDRVALAAGATGGAPRSLNCSVRLAAPGTFPTVALASPPGAGNTWTRHLIQQATGFFTGSEYRYLKIAKTGYDGEMENFTSGTTLTFKTHCIRFARNQNKVPELSQAAILLIRNPCSLAITERNREATNQTGLAEWSRQLQNDRAWFNKLVWQVHFYENFVNNWIGLGKPILVLHYENIKEDAVREIRRVVKFLNLTVDEERMECVRRNTEGNYHRKYGDKAQLYRDVLPPPIKRYAQLVMERVSDFLVEHGQDPVPWKNMPPGILPNT
ncbi:sialate:O-sulfotransferase 1-like [Ptychodera flava]|uniref:sialate:O-sulfotransferase 1-like n=1 Tax=Ptychodera flava TaxID=63121 RepID=UPI003969CCF1